MSFIYTYEEMNVPYISLPYLNADKFWILDKEWVDLSHISIHMAKYMVKIKTITIKIQISDLKMKMYIWKINNLRANPS